MSSHVLVSGTAYFADMESAAAWGYAEYEVRHPKRTPAQVVVDLGTTEIDDDDWRTRQSKLDVAVTSLIEAANVRYRRELARPSSLVLRISLVSEEGQLSFNLRSELIARWIDLGGDIAIDA